MELINYFLNVFVRAFEWLYVGLQNWMQHLGIEPETSEVGGAVTPWDIWQDTAELQLSFLTLSSGYWISKFSEHHDEQTLDSQSSQLSTQHHLKGVSYTFMCPSIGNQTSKYNRLPEEWSHNVTTVLEHPESFSQTPLSWISQSLWVLNFSWNWIYEHLTSPLTCRAI